MKHILILLITITTTMNSFAQEIWTDYVIGKPMQGYFDAKASTAKEWGINYEVIYAGCVISKDIEDKYEDYKAKNEAYLESLANKFGKDWTHYFNLEVHKKMNLAQADNEKGVWIDPVIGKPYMAHFDAKKVVAKKWGIHYEPKFMGCEASEEAAVEMQAVMEKSNAYLKRLTALFGENWQEDFNREVELQVAKDNAPIIPIPDDITKAEEAWVDVVIGKPFKTYFDAKEAIAKEWGIIYGPKFVGCARTPAKKAEKKIAEKKNKKYFAKLAERYGEDWKVHFDREVQIKIAQIRLENEQKSKNKD